MVTDLIEFEVTGTAVSQGSVAYHPVRGKDGLPVMRDGRPVLMAHHQNPKLKAWRDRVAANARVAMKGQPPWTGAVDLLVTICRQRPKAHFNSRGKLKSDAPVYPITRPDTLKQVRGIEDALTGVVWLDDSQVVGHRLRKMFSETPHVLILVKRRRDLDAP